MNRYPEARFELDPRLAADTAFVADWPLCRILLMDDARFPWLVLVPRRRELVELDDLDGGEPAQLMDEIRRAAAALRASGPCDKINVGALGNVVRQLHVHVVARRVGDAAWPGPVWGTVPAQPYASAARTRLIDRLRSTDG